MKKFQVIISDSASKDLKEIIQYIANDSTINARKILNKFRIKINELKELPERGRICPELKDNGINIYREILINPWRILYRVTGNTVFIITIIDSRRDLNKLLTKKISE